MEIKEHTHDMIALTKRIQALERKQTRLVQTIRSKAREIESEKIEVSQGCAEKTHKEQQAGTD